MCARLSSMSIVYMSYFINVLLCIERLQNQYNINWTGCVSQGVHHSIYHEWCSTRWYNLKSRDYET